MSTRRPMLADAAHAVSVRAYAVGFGDAFLLTYPDDEGRARRMLFDCGSIARPLQEDEHVPPTMDEVVAGIIEDCRDAPDRRPRIDVVVATHRHRDHISGFASARWDEVDVGEVWLPWTEDPEMPEARALQARHAGLARQLGTRLGLAVAGDDAALEASLEPVERELGERRFWLAAAAFNATPNLKAMRTLLEGFQGQPPRRFLPATEAFPERLRTDVLPGMQVRILGPSRDEAVIRRLEPHADESYFRLEAGPEPGALRHARAPVAGAAALDEWTVAEADHPALVEALGDDRDAIGGRGDDTVDRLTAALDGAINGTSLVLMLTLGDAYLLFPGDAQWGTWERMLQNPGVEALLKRTTLLKIGHHGSHNATPRTFVDTCLPPDARAMLSTRPRRWASIPRKPLLDAIEDRTGTEIADTSGIRGGAMYVETLIPTGLTWSMRAPRTRAGDLRSPLH